METGKMAKEFDTLKHSVEDMSKHLSALSVGVLSEGKTQSKELAQETVHRLQGEFGILRKKIGDMGERVTMRVKSVDQVVHKKPYWFLAGAAGIGYLLAKTRQHH